MEDEVKGEKEVTLQSLADDMPNAIAYARSIFGITVAASFGPIDDDETIDDTLAAFGL